MYGVCGATGSLWCVVGPTMSSKRTGDWHSRVPEAGHLKVRFFWALGLLFLMVVESNCGMPIFLYTDVLFLCELPPNVRERPRGWRLHLQETLRAVQICEAKLWLRRSHRLLCEHCAGSGHFDGLCGRSLLPVNLRLGWERKMGSKKANRAQLLRLNRIEYLNILGTAGCNLRLLFAFVFGPGTPCASTKISAQRMLVASRTSPGTVTVGTQ